jgi:hypothetical protein
MAKRRHDDRGSLQEGTGAAQLIEGSKAGACEFPSQRVGPLKVGIDDAYQTHRLAMFGELVINPGVISPEGSGSDHGHLSRIGRFQGMALLSLGFWLRARISDRESILIVPTAKAGGF